MGSSYGCVGIVSVGSHRGMLAHRYLWAVLMYARIVNVDAHMRYVRASLCVGSSYGRVRGHRQR